MHYFIDGYNLLFRLLHSSGSNLQSQREAIIYDLNKKIALVKIDVSIVFDATSQIGGGSRTHYDHLEILYTAEGETADEYIIEEIKNHPQPQQEIIVTSDKKLSWLVRNRSAHTETVEEFTLWLNRSYKNKLKQLKKEKIEPPPPSFQLPQKNTSPLALLKDAPIEDYTDYYAKIFESEWEAIQVQEEEKRKKELACSANSTKRPPRKPKKHHDPFEVPPSPEEKAATELERWLKIFEHKSRNK